MQCFFLHLSAVWLLGQIKKKSMQKLNSDMMTLSLTEFRLHALKHSGLVAESYNDEIIFISD